MAYVNYNLIITHYRHMSITFYEFWYVDLYGFRMIKLGVALNTFGDNDFSKKADIIEVEGMFKSLGLDLVKNLGTLECIKIHPFLQETSSRELPVRALGFSFLPTSRNEKNGNKGRLVCVGGCKYR